MKRSLLFLISSSFIFLANAQDVLTAKDYQNAENQMGYNTQKYVDRGNVMPNWIPGDKFWYRVLTPAGSEFVLVDASKGIRTVAFDHEKLAASLSTVTGKKYTGSMLPFQFINYSADGKSVTFRTDGKQWKYDLQNSSIVADTTKLLENAQRSGGFGRGNRSLEVLSPDKTKAAFIKDYNLWIRDTKTNEQKQLTTDGIKDFGYATDNAGWTSSDGAILRWSPDSKKIATFKQDQRNVGDMYLASTNVGHPTLKSWKYPLPGDKEIPMISRCVINIDDAKKNAGILPISDFIFICFTNR